MAMERELLNNAARKPCTLIYPFEKREPPAGLRGKHTYNGDKCTGCGLCSRVCPSFAIELKGLGPKCEGLIIDLGKCLFCQQCEEVCPTDALNLSTEYELAVLDRQASVLNFKRTPRPPTPPPQQAKPAQQSQPAEPKKEA